MSIGNTQSGFEKAGMVPLNLQRTLQNPATRQSQSDEPLPDPPDLPEVLSSALLTSPEKLRVLAAKPQRMFAGPEPVIDGKAQWTQIICQPHPQGRLLAAPSGFLWPEKADSGSSQRQNPPRIMAYRWDGFDPELLWSVVIHLAPEAPKLICCASNE
jgi:hypothetical protein